MVAYQCLRCRATASQEAGCPACGAPPDPLGVELGTLTTKLAELDRRDVELRVEYASLTADRQRLQQRIAQTWEQVNRRGPLAEAAAAGGPALSEWTLETSPEPAATQIRRPSPRPHPTPAPAPAPVRPMQPGRHAAPAASRPEASTRSVQNILLILGGLLLGVAAIVFTAVAWTYVGLWGRAAILLGITGIALAVPVVLRRRQLTATAETIASLGLLLVLLDGYAAWTVNLLGVHQLSRSGYTALVFAVTSAIAAAYQPVSRLSGPWFWALVTFQPVLPLLAYAGDTGLLGFAVAFAGAAALHLAVVTLLRRTSAVPSLLAPLALALGLLHGGLAMFLALLRLGTTQEVATATGAGLVLVLTALLGVAGAAGGKLPPVRPYAAGVAAVALVIAIARPVALLFPGYGLLTAAVVTIGVWAAGRTVPEGWRTGPLVACWVTAGLVALPAAAYALLGGATVLTAGLPPWHADLDAWQRIVADAGVRWQQLLVLALLSGASLVLAPESYRRLAGHHAAVAGFGLVTFGATAGLQLPWWSAPALGVLAGVGLVAAGAYAHGEAALGRAVTRSLTGFFLLGYAALASLVRPGATAATCAAIALGGAVVAVIGRRAGSSGEAPTPHGRVLGGLGTAVGIALLPAIAGSLGAALSWPEAAAIPAMMGAASLGLGVAAGLRFGGSGYVRYGVAGVSVATAVTTLTILPSDQPTGVYAAVAGLIGVAGGMLLLPSRRNAAIGNCTAAGLPFTVAAISVLPGVAALAQPYLWAGWYWQGTGDGTRELLSPGAQQLSFAPDAVWYPDVWDPLTLVLITLAAGVAAHGLRGPRWVFPAVLPGAVAALLVTPVAYDWRWPALPLIALGLAVAAALIAGLLPRAGVRSTPAVLRATTAIWPVTGSIGLANCLATPLATLVGLATATVTAGVVALFGRTVAARVTGWIGFGAAAGFFASAAGKYAGLTAAQRGYGILGIALVLLVAAAALPAARRTEMLTTERMSFLVAFYAIAIAAPAWLTVAILLAGYGAMLGLSAVRPGRRRLLLGAAGCELIAWWIFLGTREVGLVEAYTLPFAAAALLGGVIELKHRPQLSSWRAYGLALAAGFLPSLGVMLGGALFGGDDPPLRRLLLGGAGLVAVLIGAVRRRQAPVVVGGTVLVVGALRELVGLWDLLPRWVPLALAGAILLALGATYEQRRRDVRRLREALSKMS